MRWRHVNGAILIGSLIVLVACAVLWWASVHWNFIGSTVFIGHISMAAMVLGAAGVAAGSLAAWRTDADAEGRDDD